MYWKMTNVAKFWSRSAPSEHKNHFKRSGSIGWCFLPDERTVSVYNSGRGFTIKVHDNMTFKPRLTQKVTLGWFRIDRNQVWQLFPPLLTYSYFYLRWKIYVNISFFFPSSAQAL